MATPYRYAFDSGIETVEHFPMGEAPREIDFGPQVGVAKRVFDAAMQFTYGKDDFHGPTLTERIRQQEADCSADGVKMEPVGNRWV